jgi:hypothetical protein
VCVALIIKLIEFTRVKRLSLSVISDGLFIFIESQLQVPSLDIRLDIVLIQEDSLAQVLNGEFDLVHLAVSECPIIQYGAIVGLVQRVQQHALGVQVN